MNEQRSLAREKVFRTVFQMDFHEDFEQIAQKLFEELNDVDAEFANLPENGEAKLSNAQTEYAHKTIAGVLAHKEEIDEIVGAHLKGWSIGRLSKQSLAILRLGVFELKFSGDIPPIAAIDEALKLADAYCDEKELAFINGVLHAVYSEATDGSAEYGEAEE